MSHATGESPARRGFFSRFQLWQRLALSVVAAGFALWYWFVHAPGTHYSTLRALILEAVYGLSLGLSVLLLLRLWVFDPFDWLMVWLRRQWRP